LGPAGFCGGLMAILALWEPIVPVGEGTSDEKGSRVQVASVVSSYFLEGLPDSPPAPPLPPMPPHPTPIVAGCPSGRAAARPGAPVQSLCL